MVDDPTPHETPAAGSDGSHPHLPAPPPPLPAPGPPPLPAPAGRRSRSEALRAGLTNAAAIGTNLARTGADAAKAGATKAKAKLDDVDPDEVTRTILDAVQRAAETRWLPAQERAATLRGHTHEQRLIHLRKKFRRELVSLGTATGAVAALPGAGTATALGVSAADMGWVTARNSDLIFTVAALHGRHEASVDERVAWVLAILVFGEDAADRFQELARELQKKAITTVGKTTIKSVNKALAKKMFKSYGKKTGAKMFGKLMPFGIGAAIGGTSAYRDVNALVRNTDDFFRRIPHDQGAPSIIPWLDASTTAPAATTPAPPPGPALEVIEARTEDIDPEVLEETRRLMDRAFTDFTDHDWDHGLGGIHAIVRIDGRVVAHASVVARTMWVDDVPVTAGYVEAVAADPDHQGVGLATAAMDRVYRLIGQHFSLGVLATSSHEFYEHLGWERWQGPTYVRRTDGGRTYDDRTPDEDGGIMVLRPRPEFGSNTWSIDLTSRLTCPERPGDDW